jgi:16S rRNA (guanine966-N2)-methyltransferase
VRQLETNCRLLGAAQVTVRQGDALRLLEQGPQAAGLSPFGIVFVDPPFGTGLVAPVLEQLRGRGWLTPDAFVYVEQETGLPAPADWEILRERTGGQAHGLLLCPPVRAEASGSPHGGQTGF